MAVGLCEFCNIDAGEELEVLASALFLDWLGQRLRGKITASVIFRLMELDEESLSAFLEVRPVEAFIGRFFKDRLFRLFISSSGKLLEVDSAENLE